MLTQPETILIFHSPRAEFNCVWNALLIYLNRKPLESDLKLLSQLPSEKNKDCFSLLYKKVRIGEIRMTHRLGMEDPFRVSFTPYAILN